MQSTEQTKLTLTVAEAAAILHISRGSAYEAVRQRQIPSVRFGRTIRIPRAALERLLEQPGQNPHTEETIE